MKRKIKSKDRHGNMAGKHPFLAYGHNQTSRLHKHKIKRRVPMSARRNIA